MTGLADFVYETRWLGLRTWRRFYRVPANPVSILLFPLIQLFVFSQPFKDIWLPRDIEMLFGATIAVGSFDVRYRVDYHDYRVPSVTSKVGIK